VSVIKSNGGYYYKIYKNKHLKKREFLKRNITCRIIQFYLIYYIMDFLGGSQSYRFFKIVSLNNNNKYHHDGRNNKSDKLIKLLVSLKNK